MEALTSRVRDAIARIEAAKQLPSDTEVAWYPYDSFGNLEFFFNLLSAASELRDSHFPQVLDLGCGDGDLAFVFENLGSTVCAVDRPLTNYNGMRGVRELKKRLKSKVEIIEADLEDGLWFLGERRFDIVLFSGVLYHLENPFRVLRETRLRARYCFLGTKILSSLPPGNDALANAPVAYLVGEDEINHDATNYWLLSAAAVQRLCLRCGWKPLASVQAGAGGERFYSFLERADLLTNGEVLDGIYDPEEWNEWRWARRSFAIGFRNGRGGPGRILLKVRYVDEFWEAWGPVSVGLKVNGAALPERRLSGPGVQDLIWDLAGAPSEFTAEFAVSHATAPGQEDQRELSLVVLSVRFSPSPQRTIGHHQAPALL